jgi:two-component system sensor kinase FixL
MNALTGAPKLARMDVGGPDAEAAMQRHVTDAGPGAELRFPATPLQMGQAPALAGSAANADDLTASGRHVVAPSPAVTLPVLDVDALRGSFQVAPRVGGGQVSMPLLQEISRPLAAAVNYLNAARRLIDRASESGKPGISALPSEYLWQAREHLARTGEILRRAWTATPSGTAGGSLQDLAGVIEDAISLAALDARRPDLLLRAEIAPEARFTLVDPVPVRQMIESLIQQAPVLLRNQASCEVLITARTCPQRSEVEVAVMCSGPEFPVLDEAEDLPPSPSLVQAPSEAGLGLAACQAILAAHGGRLWTERREEGGGAFRFTMPLGAKADV